MALKSLEDGRAIQRILSEKPLKRAVILGMGYIALEMCGALRTREVAVDMIKPGPVFLPWLHPDLAAVVRQELEANEVRLHLGRKPQKIEPVETVIQSRSRAHAHPGSTTIHAQMAGDRRTGKLLGAQMVGREGVAHRINAPAVALHAGMTVADFSPVRTGLRPALQQGTEPIGV